MIGLTLRRRVVGWAALLAVFLALATAAAGPALAADRAPFGDVAPVTAATLAESRGGMRIGSFDFDIGVAISTALDEGVALTSRFQAVGGRLNRTAADTTSVVGGLSELAGGGVAWLATEGLTVLHDPSGLGAAAVFNQLDNQVIRNHLEVNIRVTNYRDRLSAIRTSRAVSGALREVWPGTP